MTKLALTSTHGTLIGVSKYRSPLKGARAPWRAWVWILVQGQCRVSLELVIMPSREASEITKVTSEELRNRRGNTLAAVMGRKSTVAWGPRFGGEGLTARGHEIKNLLVFFSENSRTHYGRGGSWGTRITD